MGHSSQRRNTQRVTPPGTRTVFETSPLGEKDVKPAPTGSLYVPPQWFCASLPAALIQRIPAARASATAPSGVPAGPLPSPLHVLKKPTDIVITAAPAWRAYCSACASVTSLSMQIRYSWAPGASSATISATAVPWTAPSSRPLQKSTGTTDAGSSPAACSSASPPKPVSMTATLTPAPVNPLACHAPALV